MKLKLHHLVVITCFSLVGIIALQVFWLYRASKENREHVLGVVENAILETQILLGLESELSVIIHEQNNDTIHQQDNHYNGRISALTEYDSTRLTAKINSSDSITALKKSTTIQAFKQKLDKAFKEKQIELEYALALVNSDGQVIVSNTNPEDFYVQKLKSRLDKMVPVYLNPLQEGRFQVAFYKSNWYFFKKLSVILFLSLGITAVCIISFISMIGMFYKNKRITEMKTDFMNNMTHELKTPISSVALAIDLLKDESHQVPALANSEYFDIAKGELERLSLLVDRVLKMAAFEKMEVQIVKTAFMVREWIEKIIQSIKPLANPETSVFEFEVYPAELIAYGDSFHLTNALQNLLENAIKYSDKNKSILKIMVLAWEDPDFFYLQVVDNGIGIKIQEQDKIFDKFYRSSYGDNHETKGYGLGLSYVKEIVNLHNGTIEVGSIIKVGTTFKIKIPK